MDKQQIESMTEDDFRGLANLLCARAEGVILTKYNLPTFVSVADLEATKAEFLKLAIGTVTAKE